MSSLEYLRLLEVGEQGWGERDPLAITVVGRTASAIRREVHSPIVRGCGRNTVLSTSYAQVMWGTTIVRRLVPFLRH